MKVYQTKDIKNIAIIGNSGSGKTTLAEAMAMINVTGGFWVTERMLLMFKGKEEKSN